MSNTMNILICGVGGQGTVLLSRILCELAVRRQFRVRAGETIGMAQRGGSVTSHVRFGTESPSSPLISTGQADVLLAFEPAEALRMLPLLSPSGTMVVADRPLQPVTATLKGGYDPANVLQTLSDGVGPRLHILPVDTLQTALGTLRPLNVALLGYALRQGLLPFSYEETEHILHLLLKPTLAELNLKALAVF
ncbi:MAG: indolepyruvate oxidoreductase subunit beta [Oscillospiraceae bacterium]|jgi:indolepyruvate ferredoxin oxidoreductase beta subunit|nr:indolepyruvate oxidoreductase subunit beta [Oscillospiraceae bacterium]